MAPSPSTQVDPSSLLSSGFKFDGTTSDLAQQLYRRYLANDTVPQFVPSTTPLPDAIQSRLDAVGLSYDKLPGILQRALLWDSGYVIGPSNKLLPIKTAEGVSMASIAVSKFNHESMAKCTSQNCTQSDNTVWYKTEQCNGDQMSRIARCIVDDFDGGDAIHKAMWSTGGMDTDIPEIKLLMHSWKDPSSNIQYKVPAVHTDPKEPAYGACSTSADGKSPGKGSIVIACALPDRVEASVVANMRTPANGALTTAWLAQFASEAAKKKSTSADGASGGSDGDHPAHFNMLYVIPVVVVVLVLIAIIVWLCIRQRRALAKSHTRELAQSPGVDPASLLPQRLPPVRDGGDPSAGYGRDGAGYAAAYGRSGGSRDAGSGSRGSMDVDGGYRANLGDYSGYQTNRGTRQGYRRGSNANIRHRSGSGESGGFFPAKLGDSADRRGSGYRGSVATATETLSPSSSMGRPSRQSMDMYDSGASNPVLKTLLNDPHLAGKQLPYDQVHFDELISKGAFGEVWVGYCNRKVVALKRLLRNKTQTFDEVNDFTQEIQLCASLNHPNIVSFIGMAWNSLENLVMVMEHLSRGDLTQVLRTTGDHLTWDQAKREIARGLVSAVAYMHEQTPVVIHRDLKSKNVLVSDELQPKLIDFGVSRRNVDWTMTAGVGTPFWTAPEVLEGTRYTEKSDIYSLGVLLVELDTCRQPYADAVSESGESLKHFQILNLVMTGKLRPTPSADCPPMIRKLVADCVQQDPAKRPTATEVTRALSYM